MKNSLQGIASRIHEERVRLDLSQTEVATKCNCASRTWRNYESGSFDMGTQTLLSFGELGADVWFILTGRRAR